MKSILALLPIRKRQVVSLCILYSHDYCAVLQNIPSYYHIYDSLHIRIRQQVVHGQADDLLGYPVRHRQVLRLRGVKPAVGRERADERIEVPAPEYIVVLQLLVEAVARHTIFFRVHEDREV